tara:strand:- start:157 stop:570 length:414 start_codon:yes stop_codon:yes gene_type:complete
MNEQISWDPSLVKKFSSSNHFKLLNQLRNEVKKYPLNNKKQSKSFLTKDINQENKNKQSAELSQNIKISRDSNKGNDQELNKSNVSFNNSKNFSIYNQTTSNNYARQNPSQISDKSKSGNESTSLTFTERLNQIDMK